MPIAVTGIHLCKTLSPTLVGIVNSLGPAKAPYLCLAPCCLPRRNQKLQISLFEAPMQRQARLTASRRRKERECFICQGPHHVRDCPQRAQYTTEDEWNQAIQDAQLKLPCWNCGQMGHKKSDCPKPTVKVPRQPHSILEMTNDIYPSEQDPSLQRYCEALAEALCLSTKVIDSGLTTTSHSQEKTRNWNRNRKSLFIVATATSPPQ